MSTSLWGRELKELFSPVCDRTDWVDLLVRSWIESTDLSIKNRQKVIVDLLVRSWIERHSWEVADLPLLLSTSLWGRELKDTPLQILCGTRSRPPCEVVNWKRTSSTPVPRNPSRPPCEVVNWKIVCSRLTPGKFQSTSLWGRELKGLTHCQQAT